MRRVPKFPNATFPMLAVFFGGISLILEDNYKAGALSIIIIVLLQIIKLDHDLITKQDMYNSELSHRLERVADDLKEIVRKR